MNQSCPENNASQIILQFVNGHEAKSDAVEPYYPTTVKEHLQAIYFEIIDAVHKAVKKRFEQPIFVIFSIVDNYYWNQ